MEKDRQTKIIAIVALFIGVATLTLGFAAFSARLIIKSKATVTPDADSFKVVLSTEQNKETAGTIAPTGNGEEATIDNSGDNPTISNLKANFVNLGEKVVYELYAVNIGEYDAYLNKINYENINDQTVNKMCIAGEGTTDSYVQSACESIRVTVKVAEDDKACQTSTYGAHKLEKKTGEKVVVEIEYNKDGVRADGSFSVEFGNITLNYSTTDSETKNVPACDEFVTSIASKLDINGRTNIVDNDNDEKISLNDKVTLGTESFYVISTDEAAGTVTMLAEWNLNVGNKKVSGTEGMQNSACKGFIEGLNESDWKCTLSFSSTNYWNGVVSTYPEWVYDENSNYHIHVENYAKELKKLGYSSVTGRLIKHDELFSLGCPPDGTLCTGPAWVLNTSFLSGSAGSSTKVWHVNTNSKCGHVIYSSDIYYGVRPVITISASEI